MTSLADLPDLFPGFSTQRIPTDVGEVFARIGGAGPPLLCLHGYPQTHVCWHRIAQDLAHRHTVVVMDLRGYGESTAPPGDSEHATYSKRAMAQDALSVMRALGYESFTVMGHDRGARVAYRMALDHPEAVERLIILDILTTADVWSRTTAETALKAYHWMFLAQPKPLPETLIAANSDFYAEHTLKSWTQSKSLDAFAPEALAHYKALLSAPERVHAVCEDYRAGATFDRAADEADRAAGRKITCPTLVLWGSDYVGRSHAGPLDAWRAWCTDVRGQAINSGHFLAEENPEDTLAALLEFLGDGRPAAALTGQ